MKQDNPDTSNENAADRIASPNGQHQTRKERSKSNPAENKSSKGEKHSLWRNFKSQSRTRQAELIFLGLVAIGTVVYAGTYVISSIFQRSDALKLYQREHSAKVVFMRPPELTDDFACEVTDTEIHLRTGGMKIWLKNIRNGDATQVFVDGASFHLVPDQKTGIPIFDERDTITDKSCKVRPTPQMKMFPLNAGQETTVYMTQSAGTQSLIKAGKVTATFGSFPPGSSDKTPHPERAPIAKDALFQLYDPVCAYYLDENGLEHATCTTYRLHAGDKDSFRCSETPIRGQLEQTFMGYCEN